MNLDMRVTMTDPRKENYFYEEAIKTLRTNIQFTGKNVKTILLTSCYPNEGKSDIAMQLAQEIGKAGKSVLLIDADLRKSAYVVRYKVKRSVKGLSEFLSGQASESEIKYTTNFQNVDIIFSGPSAPNPSELLEDPAISSDEVVIAQNDTFNNTSILQPFVSKMNNCWTPVENMGKGIRNGSITHDNAAEQTEQMNEAMNSDGI